MRSSFSPDIEFRGRLGRAIAHTTGRPYSRREREMAGCSASATGLSTHVRGPRPARTFRVSAAARPASSCGALEQGIVRWIRGVACEL